MGTDMPSSCWDGDMGPLVGTVHFRVVLSPQSPHVVDLTTWKDGSSYHPHVTEGGL